MTVEEVLILASKELNLPDTVRACIQGTNNGTAEREEVQSLLHAFNMVENELAMDYLPLYTEEEIATDTGAVFYTSLTRKPVRILGVKDETDGSVRYEVFPEYVKTEKGKVRIRYTYMPDAKALDGESDYQIQASARLLAYGVATEYCLSRGLFDDASVWEKKYKQALKSAYKAYPSVVLRTRRWA